MHMRIQTSPRLAALAGAAVAVMALTGCAAGAGDAATTDTEADSAISALVPDEIKATGKLRVAMDGANPPFESLSEEDGTTYVGLDPDLAREMGALMGLEVEFVPTSFDGIIPGLQAGAADIAMNSIGDTKEREEVVDFVTYYHNGSVALVASGNPMDLTASALCGAKVGVLRGSLQQNTMLPAQAETCAADGKEAPVESAFQQTPDSLLALQSGQVDAVLADVPTLVNAKNANPAFEIAGPAFKNPNPGGVALPKGSELVEAVHAAVTKLMEDGTYEELIEEYDLGDIAIEESVVNGAVS
jgi:polar amino acid transport system substrate-binding protein